MPEPSSSPSPFRLAPFPVTPFALLPIVLAIVAVASSGAHAATGDRVSITIPFHDVANDLSFWADVNGMPMLVVMDRDIRSAAQRQQGLPPRHDIDVARGAAAMVITGTIARLPSDEAMYSWGLTNADRAEARRQGVYLRAESVHAAARSGG